MDGEKPDNGKRVEVTEGNEPAVSEQDTDQRTLAQRMAAIRSEAQLLGKEDIPMSYTDKATGKRKEYTIKGHTVEGVLAGIRPLLEKHGVWILPSIVERTYNGNRCDVIVEFHFENLDDPGDVRVMRWAGADTDNGGKGFAKAGTNALKEMLKKTFLITDRADQEEETENTEHVTDDQVSKQRVQEAEEKANAAMMSWATNYRKLLQAAPDVESLDRIKRANSAELGDPALPKMTKDFLDDEFKRIRAELNGDAA